VNLDRHVTRQAFSEVGVKLVEGGLPNVAGLCLVLT
jgi:hypothetical protein